MLKDDHDQNFLAAKLGLITMQTLSHVALVVRDYDEALAFFTRPLNFVLLEDTRLNEDKRWVLMAPRRFSRNGFAFSARGYFGAGESHRESKRQASFLFLHTDDFWRDYREMIARKVVFIRPPQEEEYGEVTVFEDLYGNK